MSPTAAVAFPSMLVTHPGDSLTMTKMQCFSSQAGRETAAQAINGALRSPDGVVVLCFPAPAI